MPLKEMTVKMSSFIKLMMNIISLEPFSLIWSQESLMVYKMGSILTFTILKTFMWPNMVEEPETIGPMVIARVESVLMKS